MPLANRCARYAFAMAWLGACTQREAPAGANIARTTRGDTVIITTSGSGVWGPLRDAAETLRVDGSSRETTFGSVTALAATPDGGVLIFDAKAAEGKVIRQFDAQGRFVRNIGRQGLGPGEHAADHGRLRLAVHHSGTILVRDDFRVVNRFAPDGRFLNGFSLAPAFDGLDDFVVAPDGSVFLRPAVVQGRQIVYSTALRYDTAGRVVDSLVEATWLPPPPPGAAFVPRQIWLALADGRALYGRTDKVGFLVVDAARKSPPLIAEVAAEPVPYFPEERAELQATQDLMSRGVEFEGRAIRLPPRTVPEHKLLVLNLASDNKGRVWVRKYAIAQRIPPRVVFKSRGDSVVGSFAEPVVLAAFQLDGTYLGELRFPINARVTIAGDIAWAIVPDDDDVPVLVKYRIPG